MHFWTISAPFAFVLASQVGFLTHLVPLISDRAGVDPGLAIAVNAVMALAGRLVLGIIIDRVAPRPASSISFLVQVGAIAVLAAAEGPAAIYGACAIYGFSVGNNITLAPLIVQREYAAAEFAAIVALSTAVIQILYAFGPGLLGILRDAYGGYGVPLAVCMALNLIASAIILVRPRPGAAADGPAYRARRPPSWGDRSSACRSAPSWTFPSCLRCPRWSRPVVSSS